MLIIAIIIAFSGSIIIITIPIIELKIINIIPSMIVNLPDAIGLFFVRMTNLSKSLSWMSFQVHPAALIEKEPIKNAIV